MSEHEVRFKAILDIAPEAIVSADESQQIIIFNRGAEQVFGYARAEVIGKSIDLLIPEEFHASHRRHVSEFVRSEATSRYLHDRQEILGRRKNGELFPAEASISKIVLNGNLTMTVILRDISKRQRTEEALRQALSEVEKLKNRLETENIYLREEIKLEHDFREIIGRSPAIKNVLSKIKQVAQTDATVLLTGETGTGKELVAQAIHNSSPRTNKPMVMVNCATMPPNLIESELFGHERGAFTTAISRQIGRFELADGGTIFLDEIADLPQELQAKLLRVLQQGEFERVGSARTLKVDARVIAAANQNLQQAMQSGGFREDLYFRLNVFPILVPPLRDRTEDIPILAFHFLRRYAAKINKNIESIPAKTMKSLQGYSWPGNVRELENIIERAVITAKGNRIQLDESFFIPENTPAQATASMHLQDVECDHILHILKETNWIIEGPRGAARCLGLNPSTLRARMKKLGIQRPS
ncbi:MAG: sigma-54 interaction domain-containing protein [bacterium]